jgi:plastocyanin
VDAQIEPVFEGLPWALGEDDDDGITQNAGQPCYLSDGLPPEEPDEPCRDDDQEQPAFDGTHTYYNSGIIPFEGPRGNTYRVPLAEDIAPGRYMFYCAVHGFGQTTEVEVVPAGTDVPSADDVARAAREEIDEAAEPLVDLFRQATSEGAIDVDGERIEGPFAGVDAPFLEHTGINEFVPRERTVKAGEPITWKMMGADHTISFNVPRYFPIMEFLDDGTVRTNPMLDPPAGGAPEPPEQEGDGPLEIDGGTWDGEGFWSSGLMAAQPFIEYTLRISEPGTYEYACLLHPPMVGTLEVTA